MKEENWSECEIAKLKEVYPFLSNKQISLLMNRSIGSIQHKATRLGIKKDKEANKIVRSLARSGANSHLWNGGKTKDKEGHILVLRKGNPMADKRGYVMEHRLIMSEHLGRVLNPDEIVHHKNGIKDDNRIENLEIMSNGEHTRLHHLGAKRSKETCKNISIGRRKK